MKVEEAADTVCRTGCPKGLCITKTKNTLHNVSYFLIHSLSHSLLFSYFDASTLVCELTTYGILTEAYFTYAGARGGVARVPLPARGCRLPRDQSRDSARRPPGAPGGRSRYRTGGRV